MIDRDEGVAPEISWQMCWGRWGGDGGLGEPLERDVPGDQVVLVTAVRVARRVGVVLEEQDVPRDAVLPEALLRLVEEVLDDPLPGLVVDAQVHDVVALGGGVLGVAPGVEVQAGAAPR